MIKSDNLVEATILALQGKLPLTETKKLSTSKKLKKENVDVIVNKEDNSTYVETPDTIVTVANKDTIEDTSTDVSTQTPDVLEVPVDSDETIVPEQDLPDDTVQDIVDSDETNIDSTISDEELNENKKITEAKKDIPELVQKAKDWKKRVTTAEDEEQIEDVVDEILSQVKDLSETNWAVEDLYNGAKGVMDDQDATDRGPVTYIRSVKRNFKNILDDFINNYEDACTDAELDESKNRKLTESTKIEDFDDAQATLNAVADYIDNYTQFGFEGDPYGDFKEAYTELAESIRNCGQELYNIYYNGTYNEEHLRDQEDEDLQESKKLRRSVRENKGKFDSKSFNEVFTKYFTQKYPNLKESKVTKLGVSENGLKIEGVLINKADKQKTICLEMKKVNNSNTFSKYQVVESKGLLRESKDKSKTLNLMIHNKNNVLECKYLVQK